ncbi:hypothetical protein V8B97DRAFT_2024706 [Scleroderma yunnanense]
MTQHQKCCPHYQEQLHWCQQFLRDATSVNPHESMQDPPVKHLKINSLNSESVVQNGATSVLQLPSSSSSTPLSPEAPIAPSSAIPEPGVSFSNHLPELPLPVDPTPTPTFIPQVILHVFNSFHTNYQHRPSYDPECNVPAHKLSNPTDNGTAIGSDVEHKLPPWPWSNMSIWMLMAWQLMGNGEKSSAETTRLVHDVLLADDFKLEDLSEFNAETAMKNMDKSEVALTPDCQSTDAPEWDGWKMNVNVKIQVPLCEKCSEGSGETFTVPDLVYCLLVSVIQAAFTDPISKWFHLTPFKHIWKSPVTGRKQQLYDELYCTSKF